MENIVKALVIAGSCFITLMVISLVFITRSNVAEYYEKTENEKLEKQILKINSKFLGYTDHDIRGYELISLMNSVVDYNSRESFNETKGFEKIKFKVDIQKADRNDFKYDDTSSIMIIPKTITNATSTSYGEDRDSLSKVVRTVIQLVDKLKDVSLDKANEDCLMQLSSRISDIIIPNSANDNEKELRNMIIKDIFGLKKSVTLNDVQINEVVKSAESYYQYTQFKRSMFVPVSVEFNNDTGRIKYIEFKIKLDSSNNIVME